VRQADPRRLSSGGIEGLLHSPPLLHWIPRRHSLALVSDSLVIADLVDAPRKLQRHDRRFLAHGMAAPAGLRDVN